MKNLIRLQIRKVFRTRHKIPLYFFGKKPPVDLNSPDRKYKAEKKDLPYEEQLEEEFPEFHEGSIKQDKDRFPLYVFLGTSSILLLFYLLQKMNQVRENAQKNRSKFKQKHFGKPSIGGYWELENSEGFKMSSDDLQGAYYIIYFGFCNCPDICPQSMMKLSNAVELVEKSSEK